jgi:hypothetical protein
MTVYVTQELKGRDLSSALTFGELQVVIPAAMEITPQNMDEVIDTAWEVLEPIEPKKDFILLSGDPVVIGLVCAVASECAFGKPLRVLRWDRLDEKYIQFDLNL